MHKEAHSTLSSHPGPLVARVGRAPGFTRTLRMLRDGKPTHVTGLRGSSFVLLAEALRAQLGGAILVVCPDEESAEDTYSDFRTLSGVRPVLFPENG